MKGKLTTSLPFLLVLLASFFWSSSESVLYVADETFQKQIVVDKNVNFVAVGMEIFRDVIDLWNIFIESPKINIPGLTEKRNEAEIIEHLLNIDRKISHLGREIETVGYNVTAAILNAFPKIIKLELIFNELSRILSQIEDAYDDLLMYMTHQENSHHVSQPPLPLSPPNLNGGGMEPSTADTVKLNDRFENETLLRFAFWATGPNYDSVPVLLKRLHNLMVPDSTKDFAGILALVKQTSQEIRSNVCNLKQSPHQVIYNLYNTIALTELKGNIMLQFSYMILKFYHKGNFRLEAQLAKNKFEKNFKIKENVAKTVLKEADRSIYRCDPKQYVEGVNYEKLTKLLQGYIENEVNLNPYGTCSENCAYYEYADYNGCFKQQFCAHQPECSGKVYECRYVDSDMNICRSSNPERRYDWVEYENKRVLGTKGICEYRNLFKVDSWWRYLFWHCSYCLCLCDDSRDSDRYFSLRDSVSDVFENKVVTGLKLVKHNRIIHLQIQQGELGPRGIIRNGTQEWKPLDPYTIDDADVENNVDYHMLTWLERSIDTDDVYGPPEHVVTGVRFRRLGGHLNLEIRITPADFAAGKLHKPEHSYWKGNDNTDASFNNPRTEIKLTNPDIPTRHGHHQLDSKHDQYVQFQATSFDADAGQSTVPFIDSQPLNSGGCPLSGIGLIHRGKSGSGGFIAPKLITYDFAPHLAMEIPF